nr:DUF334 domain-containing protein [Staphylococcus aureus]
MIEIENDQENRNRNLEKLIKKLDETTTDYSYKAETAQTKYLKFLNDRLKQIDSDKVKEKMLKEYNDLAHFNQQAKEEIKQAHERNKSVQKWFKFSLVGVFAAFVLFAVLSTFLGGMMNVFGVPQLYDNLNHAIKRTESLWGVLWYLGYLVPYLMLGGFVWLLFALLEKYR